MSAEEGLYFVGIPFQFGLGSILIHGAAKDAKYVVDRIAEQPGRLFRWPGRGRHGLVRRTAGRAPGPM